MSRDVLPPLPALMAALFAIGCASADDAADPRDPSSDAPSTPSASQRPSDTGSRSTPSLASSAAAGGTNALPEGTAGQPASEAGTTSPEPLGDGEAPSFASDVLPILSRNCGPCHASPFLPRFAVSDPDAAYAVAVNLSDEIITRLDAGSMPPSCSSAQPGASGCVSAADFALIERWVESDTPE